MVEKIVRCPYCTFENHFKEMVAHVDGRFICRKCGHMAMPSDPNFRCACPKCCELSFPAYLGSRRVS
jgi:hypothetical protein